MGLEEIRKKISLEKDKDRYFVIERNWADLRKLDEFVGDTTKLGNPDSSSINQFCEMEEKVTKYCEELIHKGIPFDVIELTGEAGFILNAECHEHIMRQIFDDRINSKCPCTYLSSHINKIEISDTLGAIPIDFKLVPEIYGPLEDDTYDILKELGFETNEGNWKTTVNLDSFIRIIKENGYSICLNNVELNSYEEYFNGLKVKPDGEKILSIKIDFRRTNNIR